VPVGEKKMTLPLDMIHEWTCKGCGVEQTSTLEVVTADKGHRCSCGREYKVNLHGADSKTPISNSELKDFNKKAKDMGFK